MTYDTSHSPEGSHIPTLDHQKFGALIVDFPDGIGNNHAETCPLAQSVGGNVLSLLSKLESIRLNTEEFPGLGAFVKGFGLDHVAGAELKPTPFNSELPENHTVTVYDNFKNPVRHNRSKQGISGLKVPDRLGKVTLSFQVTEIEPWNPETENDQ